MSDQEMESENSPVVLVQQPVASRHKGSFRPNDLNDPEGSDLQHKRSRAPAVPSVAEELKDITLPDSGQHHESDRELSSEKLKHTVAKKLSSKVSRRQSSPEPITLATIEVNKKPSVMPTPQPIPEKIPSASLEHKDKEEKQKEADADSITDEVAELRTPVVAKKTSNWSDEEEAGGLPRSESRASRVSRAVRQLFCCGVAYEAPSEHDISPRPYEAI